MPDTLYSPNLEQIVTTNAWAFLHWLRSFHGIDLPDWAALQRWSASERDAFDTAIAEFAHLPDAPHGLVRHEGPQEALVLRRAGGGRHVLSRDAVRALEPDAAAGSGGSLPTDVVAPLIRHWLPGLLIRPLADVLLFADVRPDDRLLVIGSAAWPWLAALLEGATVIVAGAAPAAVLPMAADERATVLVASARILAEAAFQRARRRPNLARLRTIIAVGGPLSPEGRTRVYTWIKPDLMLLARTGDTVWGNPLEPVSARPAASPGFFTRPT